MPAASSPSTTATRPPGCHALQIEINRALYMDERRFERTRAASSRVARDLMAVADALMREMADVPGGRALAAE